MTLTKLDPQTVADGVKSGEFTLVDLREPDEYAREHIEAAVSMPLSSLDKAAAHLSTVKKVVFHCKSGMRTDANCARIETYVNDQGYILAGGLDAWKSSGLPTKTDASAPLEINRQVQITAGLLILAGALLGYFVNPAFIGISAFVGAGLLFAGLSGWCGMANLLAVMPWNKAMKTA